jgi:CreA protein
MVQNLLGYLKMIKKVMTWNTKLISKNRLVSKKIFIAKNSVTSKGSITSRPFIHGSHLSLFKALLGLSIAMGLVGCSDDVGKVSLGLFTTKDVVINAKQDPIVTGVTCHISHVEADLDFSDPSDMSIACRQTGEISAQALAKIDRSKNGEVVFKESKSILFKSLKVRRIYDAENKSLIYLSYSTKESSGSHHHSLSTVPLYNTKAWQWALAQDVKN